MECQTCSDHFTTPEALHEHIGFFQSQAQYHVRELLRCLAHVRSRPDDYDFGDIKNDNDLGHTGGPSDVDSENEKSSVEDVDLRCPQTECSELKEFRTLKELQRHFAIHTPCYELCPPCGRVMERASTYLHHNCKKGRSTSHILQRRKALRRQVDLQLREARAEISRGDQPRESINGHIHQRHKRRRTENVRAGIELPTIIGLNSPEHDGELAFGLSTASTSNVEGQPASSNTETFSTPSNLIPTGSSLDLSLNLQESSLPHSQFYHNLPNSELSRAAVAEYGAHGLTSFMDMIPMAKAPLMYTGTTLVSKAPLMYNSMQVFGMREAERELIGQTMLGSGHGENGSVGLDMVTSTERSTGDEYGALGY